MSITAPNNPSLRWFILTMITLPVFLYTYARANDYQNYQEAPMLAAQVVDGNLPDVSERLPLEPMVVTPIDRVGTYGGTWRSALIGASDHWWLIKTLGYEHLVRWDIASGEIIPNIARAFEVNDEATEFTFHLRKGMKWSDGHPFTADDILFWYEDVFMDEELSPAQSGRFLGVELAAVEAPDDTTVIFRFAEPNGLFLQRLASLVGITPTLYPRHYLEQFHPTYNPDGIDALVQASGFQDWAALFTSKVGNLERWGNNELPSLMPWVVTQAYGEGQQVVAERNPYYWKVDTAGNQLPYLDRTVLPIVGDTEVLLLKALSGEVDMIDRHINTNPNKPVLLDNMTQGNYTLFEEIPSLMNTMVIFLNLNHQNPVLREIFQNKDLRIGLSYAINRQEIIDLIYVGQGEPYQAAPRPESEFYDEQFAKQYTNYDVNLANEHLDQAGYRERNAAGIRLGPDGRPIIFTVEVATDYKPHFVDMMELIRGYWLEVGVDAQIRPAARSLILTRQEANEHDVLVWHGDGGLGVDLYLELASYLPTQAGMRGFARLWANWPQYGDPDVEEPPAATRQQIELYNRLTVTSDPAQQADLMREILNIAKQEFYVIGISLEPNGYGIVRNDFHNVPDEMPLFSALPTPAVSNPEQYFIEGSPQTVR